MSTERNSRRLDPIRNDTKGFTPSVRDAGDAPDYHHTVSNQSQADEKWPTGTRVMRQVNGGVAYFRKSSL